ncbi:PVC-type heme-binding CxxCH protein [Luteolibacter sp. Populi]|uniref:PVC-type heme-binding CxxCH protein n=1 Tax=Luteolibacter sp. Populi TaxID=3230487 RepID=UPI003465D12D
MTAHHRSRSFLAAGVTGLLAFVPVLSHADDAAWEPRSIPAKDAQENPGEPLWYRAHLRVPASLVDPIDDTKDLWRESMTLALQDIPGRFKVTLNGIVIIESANADSAAPQRFKIPKDILKNEVFNTLAIRLEGKAAAKGLVHPPVFGGYLDEVRLARDWLVRSGEVPPADLLPLSSEPATAAYNPQDWRPASTVLQAPVEPVRGKQVAPAEALTHLKAADDLRIESLLHEPEVAQPTHISFDARGRMWIAQYRQYPYPAGLKMISRDAYYRGKYDKVPPAPPLHDPGADIVSVHEDSNGDGVYDTHKKVLTGLNMANSVLHGHGGIWVTHAPYLLFYPDADGDDIPDKAPEVRLAGFGLEDTHSTVNGLTWGPDGWLYGAQGSTVSSHISRPGIDAPDATPLYLEGCAVWRYHPATKEFEIFADGGGNVFGLHFDGEGRLFSGHNGGDTRGWHHIQEGIYLKQGTSPDKFGPPTNPYSFGELSQMASSHPIPRFTHNIVMLEGSAFPERWRGLLLGADPLHRRLTASKRIPAGSSFTTTDTDPALTSDDVTFRPVYLTPSPDGSITIADFREEYIAHGQNYQGQIDPATGRVYRLRGKSEALVSDVNLSGKSDAELIGLLSHPNLWHRQTAVRLLAERKAAIPDAASALSTASRHQALGLLWVLHQTGALDEALTLVALKHPEPMLRAWAIRVSGDRKQLSPGIHQAVLALATSEPDAEVRCQILSTCRRLPRDQALPLTAAILTRDVDTQDPFIPLMAWFILESHCGSSPDSVIDLLKNDPSLWDRSIVRTHIASRLMRRFAEAGSRNDLLHSARLIQLAPSPAARDLLMGGFGQAFSGRPIPALPPELADAMGKLGKGALILRVRRADPAALEEALTLLSSSEAPASDRLQFARIFGEIPHPPAVPILLAVALNPSSGELSTTALSSLSLYENPEISTKVVEAFPRLPRANQDAALALLAARPGWTLDLLRAIETGIIPQAAISPDLLARLRLHQEEDIRNHLAARFPAKATAARESFRPRIEAVKKILSGSPGDPYTGESIFMERCAACHQLFHKGGKIGPNLTSYQREDLDTMLVSIIDPNAEIREGYGNHLVSTKDGRVLGGFLADQDNHVIVLRGFDGNDSTIPRSGISGIKAAGLSLMPEGLIDNFTDTQLRNLFAYIRIPQPISK